MRRYKLPVGQMAFFDLSPEEVVQPKQEVPIPQEVPASTEVSEQVVPLISLPPLPLALKSRPGPCVANRTTPTRSTTAAQLDNSTIARLL